VKSDAQHRSGQPERRGFTLLETLLVLGLISMLAAVLVGGSAQLLKGTARSDPEDALMAMLQTLSPESRPTRTARISPGRSRTRRKTPSRTRRNSRRSKACR
jgi:prepilin-type N-terminal cleavage/methylation domain-containing protein